MIKPIVFSLLLSALVLPARATCKPKVISDNRVISQVSMAQVNYQGSTWTLTKVIGHRKQHGFNVVYRQKNDVCYLTFNDVSGDSYSLSEGVPRPVAIAFAKAYVKTFVTKYGRDKLVQKYQKGTTIAPEDAEAMNAAGVPLPKGVKILPWATPQKEQRL
jgi:hypothetical protein